MSRWNELLSALFPFPTLTLFAWTVEIQVTRKLRQQLERETVELSQLRALAESHGKAHGVVVFAFRLLQERWKRW